MAGTVQRSEIDAFIGQRVHHVLWRRKIPQTELAVTLGITQSTLSRRLRGESAWFAGDLVALAETLGVSVGWLFGEDETVRPKGLEPLTFWSGVRAFRAYRSLGSCTIDLQVGRRLRARCRDRRGETGPAVGVETPPLTTPLPGISHDGGAIRADEHGTRPVVTRPGTVAVRADWNDPTYRCARCGWPSWTWLCRVCAAAVRTDDLALAA